MELIKRELHTNTIGRQVTDQFVLDDDFTVPDGKPDIRRVLSGEAGVRVEEVKRVENYVRVSGKLIFRILCVTGEGIPGLTSLEGSRPFEEMIYTEEEGTDYIVRAERAEFSAVLIHARKLGIKAVVDLTLHTETPSVEPLATEIDSGKQLMKKYREIEPLELVLHKRDVCRIKEEISVPATKENIGAIIWSEAHTGGVEIRPVQDAFLLTGTMQLFCIYESQDGKLDWVEQSVPWESRMECPGVEESMYHHVYVTPGDTHVEARMDSDGEMRAIGLEASLELRILAYQEQHIPILEDVYSLDEICTPKKEKTVLEELILKNHTRHKIAERIELPEIKEEILQICHTWAGLQTERMEIVPEGLRVEGVLYVNFLYIKADDEMPFDVWQGMVPVSCVLESGEECPQMRFDVTSDLEQASVMLAGNGEVEIRAVLSFQSFFRRPVRIEKITDLEFAPLDEGARERIPGIVGYIVKEGDELWTLAKRYLTTVESIMEMNGLTAREVKPGDKILIFKQNTGIL